MHPALVESAQLDWFSDPEKRSDLLSVQSYYPMEGRVLPMLNALDNPARAYLEGLVTDELAGVDGSAGDAVPAGAVPGLARRPAQVGGVCVEAVGTFGTIKVFEFSDT